MAVLIQEVVCGDYAFVIQTKNPLSGIPGRVSHLILSIQTKIVKGLGETLVGAYPGRAMSFFAKKMQFEVSLCTGYLSKNIGLYSKPSIIFRSDSNGEDPEGYDAGAGLYDSALTDKEEKIVLDNSSDRKNHRKSLRSPP
uniref:Uncharacterized protein n=1 Tax=Populus trichocarpa TaxID=3694 RepID=B9GN80_POPTR